MGQLADLTMPAAELYVLRFCVGTSKLGVPIAHKRYRALLDFAQIEWRPRVGLAYDHVTLDREPVTVLTSEHFNLIQSETIGFSQLFVWFPPRTQPSGDEARLLVRAGVNLNLCRLK